MFDTDERLEVFEIIGVRWIRTGVSVTYRM
jgi:hypothetical protein